MTLAKAREQYDAANGAGAFDALTEAAQMDILRDAVLVERSGQPRGRR